MLDRVSIPLSTLIFLLGISYLNDGSSIPIECSWDWVAMGGVNSFRSDVGFCY